MEYFLKRKRIAHPPSHDKVGSETNVKKGTKASLHGSRQSGDMGSSHSVSLPGGPQSAERETLHYDEMMITWAAFSCHLAHWTVLAFAAPYSTLRRLDILYVELEDRQAGYRTQTNKSYCAHGPTHAVAKQTKVERGGRFCFEGMYVR